MCKPFLKKGILKKQHYPGVFRPGKMHAFLGCTRLTQDTCTSHQRKYQSVILITIKVLNIGTDRSDPDQTAPNYEQSDQGLLLCYSTGIFNGICIHCNKKGDI